LRQRAPGPCRTRGGRTLALRPRPPRRAAGRGHRARADHLQTPGKLNMNSIQAFGLAHLWAQSDFVIRAVAALLLLMSVTSWYLILLRGLRQLKARRFDLAVEAFWAAPSLDHGLRRLHEQAPDSPFEALARQGAAAAEHVRRHEHQETLGGRLDAD